MVDQPERDAQRFRLILDNLPAALALYDADRRFEFLNRRAVSESGLREEDFIGRRDTEVLPSDLTDVYLPALNRCYETRTLQSVELSVPARFGGGTLWVTYVPELDESGNVVRVIGMTQDITERKRAEEELRRAQTLAQGMNVVLELLATGSTLSHVLHALVNMIQRQSEGVAASVLLLDESGKRLRHGAAPDLPPEYSKLVENLPIGPAAGSCGTAAFLKTRVIAGDLSTDPHWADFREVVSRFNLKACWSQPIFSSDRRVLGSFALYPSESRGPTEPEIYLLESAAHVAGIAIEHHQTLAETHRAREAAEQASRAKDDFLATVSHELRTPVAAILLWAKLLKSGGLDRAAVDAALDTIIQSAGDQSRLIATLLDASRILQGKALPEFQRLEFSDLVADAIRTLKPMADAKGVRIQQTLIGCPMNGDPALLRQVVANLLENAIKFTPPGGTVRVNLTRDPRNARLELIDTGIGMRPEFLSRAFERFQQDQTPLDRGHGGMGLGLSIVRDLVNLHGGSVHAASPGPEQGSTFTVILPLAEPP